MGAGKQRRAKWCFPKSGCHPPAASPYNGLQTLTTLYSRLIVNPVIVLKVPNREVTVLGEVKSPGTLQLEKEYTSLVEVLWEKWAGPNTTRDARILNPLFAEETNRKKEYTLWSDQALYHRERKYLATTEISFISSPSNVNHCKGKPVPSLPVAAILSSLAVFLTREIRWR